jgi:Asp-tRNA(Asn)/Glu-tRNA(Gln) amidotransferase A subunit family amidase
MNYSAEELFKSALEKAKECDAERMTAIEENRQNELPYLHGIPISVKELFD